MSLNGYSYVEGNPVNWTDPSGMNVAQLCWQAQGLGPWGQVAAQACLTVNGLWSLIQNAPQASNTLKSFISSANQIFTAPFVLGQSRGVQFFGLTEYGNIRLPNQSLALSQADMTVLQQQFQNAACGAIAPGMPGSCAGTGTAQPGATPVPGGVVGDAGNWADLYDVLSSNVCYVQNLTQLGVQAQAVATSDSDDDDKVFYHYTRSENVPYILATGLLPSLRDPDDPSTDANWGDGQYFTDLTPQESSTVTRGQHSYALFRNPRKWGTRGRLRNISWVRFNLNDGSVEWRAPLFGPRFPERGIYLRWNHSPLLADETVTGYGDVTFQPTPIRGEIIP